MCIAVLGSGNMGAALGRLFAAAGHGVTFSYSRDPAKLDRLARQNGPKARAAAPRDAVCDADVVLLAVHWQRFPRVQGRQHRPGGAVASRPRRAIRATGGLLLRQR
jgi:predicted dinucleotide-binding enzyme